jgi:transcriptional regulator with XRE-family HTH domain
VSSALIDRKERRGLEMNAITTRYDELNTRRREAGISYSALAELSGVSQPALQRLLNGKVDAPGLTSVAAIARVLGIGAIRFLDDGSIRFDTTMSTQALREQQARRKAARLVGMVQGTSALEGQAVSQGDYQSMVEGMYHELLAGPNHRLWSL